MEKNCCPKPDQDFAFKRLGMKGKNW